MLPTDQADRLDYHLRVQGVLGTDARDLAGVAAPEYETAFIKKCSARVR